MKSITAKIILTLFLFTSIGTKAQFTYKINIQADPLLKSVNGNMVAGETNVRLKLYGSSNQTMLVGKLMVGDFTTVTKKDQPDIGNVIGIDVELTGNNWTSPVKISNISVKKENEDGSVSKKYSFSCGCTLTQGNSKVQIDEAGAMDFKEAQIADPEFKIDGEFSVEEVSFKNDNVSGTISKKNAGKKETKDGPPVAVPSDNPKVICTEEKVNATASFDVNFILNPNEANLFPGAMLYSEDIANGSYSSYASGSDLNPIRLTTSLGIVGGNPTITVPDPDLGSVNTAINDLFVNQTKGKPQVQASFEISEVNSMEELILKIGAYANSATFDANLKFDLTNHTRKSIKMIKFVEKYYTVTMVQPNKPTDLFKNKKMATEAFQSGKTPLYVNSITYGRVAYFFMETELSNSDIQAHVDGQYKGSVTAGGNVDVQLKKDKSKSLYSGTIIGGSGAIPIGGFDEFMDFIRNGGNLDQTSLAVPVAYSCKFLADNKQAYVNLFSSFTKRTCKPIKSDMVKAVFKLEKIKYVSGDRESVRWGYLFEAKTYKTFMTATTPFLISKQRAWYETDRDNYVTLKKGEESDIDITTAAFEFNVNDYQNGEQKIYLDAEIVKVDWGVFNEDYKSSRFEKTLMLKDALKLDSGPAALPRTFRVQYEDAVLEFIYRVEILD